MNTLYVSIARAAVIAAFLMFAVVGATASVPDVSTVGKVLRAALQEPAVKKMCTIRVINSYNKPVQVCVSGRDKKKYCVVVEPGQSGNLIFPCDIYTRTAFGIGDSEVELEPGGCGSATVSGERVTASYSRDGLELRIDDGDRVPCPDDRPPLR